MMRIGGGEGKQVTERKRRERKVKRKRIKGRRVKGRIKM